MKDLEQIFFDNRNSFREWLEKNHKKSSGIWMIFYKKHTNVAGINYNEALEEALCFGWIDSIIKKADNDRYLRKFTPRLNTHNWSDVNKKLVLSLMEQGKMTEAGLEKIENYPETKTFNWNVKKEKKEPERTKFQIPEFILKALARNEPALENFNNLTQSYKLQYIRWITYAKRNETIRKRLTESITLLKENRKLGLK
jgi:uncharacterized protein YdeI (YjbR/CyaY-like superfamily)